MNDTLLPEISTNRIVIDAKSGHQFGITHELGRKPQGWLVIDQDKPANVWRSGAMDKTLLELTADQDVTLVLVIL